MRIVPPVLGKAWLWRLGGAGRGRSSPRSFHLARAKALGGFLQKPGQVREETAPRGPAFLVPLPLVFSSPCFLHCDRFRFLTTLLGSTRTPASNTDLSVTQWPTAPSALSSSPSSPSSLVRGCKVGRWGMFPFPTAPVGSWGSPMRCLGPGCSSLSPPCWTCCL